MPIEQYSSSELSSSEFGLSGLNPISAIIQSLWSRLLKLDLRRIGTGAVRAGITLMTAVAIATTSCKPLETEQPVTVLIREGENTAILSDYNSLTKTDSASDFLFNPSHPISETIRAYFKKFTCSPGEITVTAKKLGQPYQAQPGSITLDISYIGEETDEIRRYEPNNPLIDSIMMTYYTAMAMSDACRVSERGELRMPVSVVSDDEEMKIIGSEGLGIVVIDNKGGEQVFYASKIGAQHLLARQVAPPPTSVAEKFFPRARDAADLWEALLMLKGISMEDFYEAYQNNDVAKILALLYQKDPQQLTAEEYKRYMQAFSKVWQEGSFAIPAAINEMFGVST